MSDFNMMNASHSMSKSLCWLPSSPTRTGKHTHTSLWWELAVPTVTHRKQEWKEKGSLLWVPNISFSLNTGCLLKIHPELPCPRLIEPRSSHHTQSQESKIKKKKKKDPDCKHFFPQQISDLKPWSHNWISPVVAVYLHSGCGDLFIWRTAQNFGSPGL